MVFSASPSEVSAFFDGYKRNGTIDVFVHCQDRLSDILEDLLHNVCMQ